MKYLEIVLNGFKSDTINHLDNYFFREFKKAEEKHYSIEEFFSGCLMIIETFKKIINKDLYKSKNELYMMRNLALNGMKSSTDEPKPMDSKDKKRLNNFDEELGRISPEEFPINLRHYTQNRYQGYLKYSDIQKLAEGIKTARRKAFYEISINESPFGALDTVLNIVNSTKDDLLPQPNTKQKIEILSDLITHKNSVKIVDSIKVKYKNIKGKRLKLLLLALQDLELLPKERIAKKFHNCCDREFNWEIASYNAMNGYSFNDITDNVEFNKMRQYIKSLLK